MQFFSFSSETVKTANYVTIKGRKDFLLQEGSV